MRVLDGTLVSDAVGYATDPAVRCGGRSFSGVFRSIDRCVCLMML